MRHTLLALALLLAVPAAAQSTVPIVDGPLEPGLALYVAEDLGTAEAPMHVVQSLYRVSPDGTSAMRMEPSACIPPCLAIAERVTPTRDGLRPVPPDWPRLGWIVTVTKAGVRVEVDDTYVGRGNMMVGVLPGDYAVSFWLGPNNRDTKQNTIPVANEVTVPNFSARRAGRTAAVAMPVAPPSGGTMLAARSVADLPVAGWTMAEPEPEPEPEPVAAAEPEPEPEPVAAAEPEPTPPPAAEPEPVSEPEPEPEPVTVADPPPATAERSTGSPIAAASCTVEGSNLLPAVGELELEGRYAEAQACLLRVVRGDRGRADLRARLARLGELKLAVDLLTAEERAELPGLRAAVEAAAQAGQTNRLLEAAARVVALVPGDIATMARLEGGFTLETRPDNGPPLAFTFVPGAASAPDRARRLDDPAAVPQLGYLLSTTEITNAQFAHFLNQIPAESDELYVVRDHDDSIVLTRAQRWEPARAAARLPTTAATWHGAQAYAEWVGGRLPTVEEWVWAFESGGGAETERDANLNEAGRRAPVAPGTFPADDIGLENMLGNVWEWTDRREDAAMSRVPIAGGSFSTARGTIAGSPTLTARPNDTDGHVGFRVLKPLGEGD